MKELSLEEKARAYDEAIERAKEMIKAMTNIGGVAKVDDIQYLFPELKESESEKIRKELIQYLKECNNLPNGQYCRADFFTWLEKQGEQKSAWSEEDEEQARQIERIVHNEGYSKKLQKQISDWLKFLKDRVQPKPKQEWDEEDEEWLTDIVCKLESDCQLNKDEITWLKSRRLHSQWKPSDLPHWKKSTLPNDNTTGFNSDYFCNKGYNINYKELFEKLPKDD